MSLVMMRGTENQKKFVYPIATSVQREPGRRSQGGRRLHRPGEGPAVATTVHCRSEVFGSASKGRTEHADACSRRSRV
jgi:hypothetical protein